MRLEATTKEKDTEGYNKRKYAIEIENLNTNIKVDVEDLNLQNMLEISIHISTNKQSGGTGKYLDPSVTNNTVLEQSEENKRRQQLAAQKAAEVTAVKKVNRKQITIRSFGLINSDKIDAIKDYIDNVLKPNSVLLTKFNEINKKMTEIRADWNESEGQE